MDKTIFQSWVWSFTAIILALRWLRQLGTSLGYIVTADYTHSKILSDY